MSLSISIYSGDGDLLNPHLEKEAKDLRYTSFVPGGFGECSFIINRDLSRQWSDLKLFSRITIRDGLTTIWEGRLEGIEKVSLPTGESFRIRAYGYWANLYDRIYNRIWADSRLKKWYLPAAPWSYPQYWYQESWKYDWKNRLRISAIYNESYAQYAYGGFRYDMPSGEYAQRLTANYDLTVATGMGTYQLSVVTTPWNVKFWTQTPGTGNLDLNLNSGSSIYLCLQGFQAADPYTAATGSTYGELTNVVIYSTSGNVYADTIIKDALTSKCSQISSDQSGIESPGYSLVPSTFDEDWTPGDVIEWCSQFDNGYDAKRWLFNVWEDRKPYFAKKDYDTVDYYTRLKDCRIERLERLGETMFNRVYTRYLNPQGEPVRTTASEYSSSISEYGLTREYPVIIDKVISTAAAQRARELFLAAHAMPKVVQARIVLTKPVQDMQGRLVPVSHIRAGKVIHIRGLITRESAFDTDDILDSEATFYIVKTEYNAERDELAITPDTPQAEAEVLLNRITKLMNW